MMKQIAVALDSIAQANCIAPYLLTIARPGTNIVFFVRTKARKAVWLQARMTAIVTQNTLAVEVCERQWEFEMNCAKRAAEQKLEALRLALIKQGSETEVWIYTGSLRKPLKRMAGSHPESFALLRPRKESLAEQLLRPILTWVGLSVTNGISKASLAFSSAGSYGSWEGNNDGNIKITRSEKFTD
ncbi:MAG TPA: hypothetical protein VF452_20865 [Candidatus Binatia bacterium]